MEKLQYLTEREVGELTHLALQTLRNYRHQGRGPVYLKAGGRAVRYRLDDVVAFMEKIRIDPGTK